MPDADMGIRFSQSKHLRADDGRLKAGGWVREWPFSSLGLLTPAEDGFGNVLGEQIAEPLRRSQLGL